MTMAPYLLADPSLKMPAGDRLRALLAGDKILQMPGAHSGLAALQAKAAGFQALYLSGGGMSAAMGVPDLGILTVDDVSFHIRQVARASRLPVLVDGDTGFGEALNVMHMVRVFEEAGAAAVQLEDQQLPKKCGHLNDKRLVTSAEMEAKIAAAAHARNHLYIVARTDAVAEEGLDSAIARARRYVAAGADAIFPEALSDGAMFQTFAEALPGVPLLANMTEFGRTRLMTPQQLQALGYKMVIWPMSALRAANKAQEKLYATLRDEGGVASMMEQLQTRAELYELIGLRHYEALDASLVPTVLPKITE